MTPTALARRLAADERRRVRRHNSRLGRLARWADHHPSSATLAGGLIAALAAYGLAMALLAGGLPQ